MAANYFLYARKSTDTEEKQVLSIEAQLTELRAFASKERLTIKHEFVEAMTAKVPGRPIFNDMIKRLENGEARGIIAWHPDRLARNSVDGGRIVYLLDTGAIQFMKFPTFWFESTPQGKFMMNIAFGQSKYYIDNLAENVKRGLRQKLRRGEWPGCAPAGYLNDKHLRKIVADPVRAPLIQRMFREFATGNHSLETMRRAAIEWGLLSRAQKPYRTSDIHNILSNTFYYGLMLHKGEHYEASHAPLITKETFERVRSCLINKGKTHKQRKHTFPLVGLAVCDNCGCAITAEIQKGYHYYRCTKKKGFCDSRYMREEKFAEQIKSAVQRVALPQTTFDGMLAALANERDEVSQPLTHEKSRLTDQIQHIQAKLDRLLEMHLNQLITATEYQKKKEVLLNEKIAAAENLAGLDERATGWLEPCRAFLTAAHQAHLLVSDGNLESQRDFLKKIGSNFRVAAATLQFSYNNPWAAVAEIPQNGNWHARRDSNARPTA